MRTERTTLKKYRHSKFSCLRDYTTWYSPNFYSTNRANLDAPVEMNIEKKFFWLGKGGGGPLKRLSTL